LVHGLPVKWRGSVTRHSEGLRRCCTMVVNRAKRDGFTNRTAAMALG
jgi:hypothetical protein